MKNNIYLIKYIICIVLLLSIFYIISLFYKEEMRNNVEKLITKSTIIEQKENYTINVDYPRFKNITLNKIVTDYIYTYIKEFKNSEYKYNNKKLNINYEILFKDNYINIVFIIDNSIKKERYHNIIINTNEERISYISEIYNKEELENKILNEVYNKYSIDIYNLIKDSNINNFTYLINDNKITIYFYNINFNVEFDPFIELNMNENAVFNEIKYNSNKMQIVFTFDDGPGEYTKELINTLEANNSSATFFMLGNKMKHNKDSVLYVYNSNSEVASHSYSHKYLTKLDNNEFLNEVNTTSIIFNEITNDTIKYIRPPYGSYNDNVLNKSPYPVILWTIDTKDWLVRDSNTIYNTIISNSCDGCIVLLHETCKETLEAVKKAIPVLQNKGYEVVSISDIYKIKKINPTLNTPIKKINKN